MGAGENGPHGAAAAPPVAEHGAHVAEGVTTRMRSMAGRDVLVGPDKGRSATYHRVLVYSHS